MMSFSGLRAAPVLGGRGGQRVGLVTATGAPRPAARLQRARAAAVETLQQAQAPYRVTAKTISDIQSLYQSLLYEYDYEIDPAWVEGTIPCDLVGTYVRNGPGLQAAQRHTFDGDGMVLSFCFSGGEGGSVRFKNRFVRTKGFVEEQAAGRPLFRTAFTRGAADGNPFFNPFDFNLKNCANTGVLAWAGKLLALYESGLPHELDPRTLETYGESTVGGQLETPVLAAHYRVVTRPGDTMNGAAGDAVAPQRDWVAFSANTGLSGTELIFYEFAEAGGKLRHAPVRAPLPGTPMALVHDIAVTEDYYVVHVGPLEFSPGKFVTEYFTSRCAIAECLRYNPSKPAKIWLVPRPGGKAAGSAPQVIEAPATFVFHHANAFQTTTQDGRRLLTLDTVAWDSISFEYNQYTLNPAYYKGGARSQLRRIVLDLGAGRVVGDHRLLRRCAEFPSVAPAANAKAHRHVYACADIVDDDTFWGPAQSVVKVSVDPSAGLDGSLDPSAVAVDSWSPGPRCIVNEPLFVPREGSTAEDDGYVLVAVHNAATGKGDLAILDARSLSSGPVATIHLPHLLPAGLHGSFSSEVLHEPSAAEPKWAEPNAIRQI